MIGALIYREVVQLRKAEAAAAVAAAKSRKASSSASTRKKPSQVREPIKKLQLKSERDLLRVMRKANYPSFVQA